MEHTVTERKAYQHHTDKLIVEIENTEQSFAWRMCVNRDWSEWTGHYAGLLVHKGYGLATAYWNGVLPEFIPFRIDPASLG